LFQALTQSQQIHKRVSAIGVRQEESLLEESATREAELLGNISELEAELRSTRQTLDQFRTESERANALATELANQVLENLLSLWHLELTVTNRNSLFHCSGILVKLGIVCKKILFFCINVIIFCAYLPFWFTLSRFYSLYSI